jgi:hypothetical protein
MQCPGFLQWKALLGLLFNCDSAATDTHTSLFTTILQCICAQLTFALGKGKCSAPVCSDGRPCDRQSSEDDSLDVLGFGDYMSELLEDSFLKKQSLDFLEVMLEERAKLPPDLWHQV